MSQAIFSDIIASITSGNQLADILNDFKDAIMSGYSGVSRPSELQAGGAWVDTTLDGSGIWSYKLYDGTQDITIFTVNKNTGLVSIASADTLFSIIKTSADSVGPQLKLLKTRIASLGQVQTGDSLGEILFTGKRDDGTVVTMAKIKTVATNHATATQQGGYISFEVVPTNGASLAEVFKLLDGKVGFNVTSPEETVHSKGTGIKTERESDDATGVVLKLRKKRISDNGKVLNNDVISSVEMLSTDDTGAELGAMKIVTSAAENHTTTAHGTKTVISTKKVGQTAYTEQIEIADNVKVKTNMTVEGTLTVLGTTTTFNSTTHDIADSNITVNKGGTQATANANKAGITVESTDAAESQLGYDSSKASRFVIGEVGSESEVITATHTQTLINKTITGAYQRTPSKSEVKQDTYANIVTWAAGVEGTNGQWLWATDTKQMFYLIDGTLQLQGPGISYSSVALTTLDINWATNTTVFYKDVTVDSTFTFSNIADGKTINVIINNTGGSAITCTFPTAKKEAFYTGMIAAGKEGIFTITRSNSKTYISSLVDMV